jgi:hypothetical protein
VSAIQVYGLWSNASYLHQPRIATEQRGLITEVMRAGAGLHHDQARGNRPTVLPRKQR